MKCASAYEEVTIITVSLSRPQLSNTTFITVDQVED